MGAFTYCEQPDQLDLAYRVLNQKGLLRGMAHHRNGNGLAATYRLCRVVAGQHLSSAQKHELEAAAAQLHQEAHRIPRNSFLEDPAAASAFSLAQDCIAPPSAGCWSSWGPSLS